MPRISGVFIGLFIFAFALLSFYSGFQNYFDDPGRRDWVATTATVTKITKSNRDVVQVAARIPHSAEDYTIDYTYMCDGITYEGTYYFAPRNPLYYVGGPIDIKYNPDDPSESTVRLEPKPREMILYSVMGFVLCFVAYKFIFPKKDYEYK